MDLEHFKRWHWILIGLIAGILYSSVRLFQGHDLGDNPTYEQNFELALMATPEAPVGAGSDEGSIYLTDVRIFPSEEIGAAMFNASHRSAAPAPRAAAPAINWFGMRRPATAKAKPAPMEPPKGAQGAVAAQAQPASQTAPRQINWITGIVHRRYRDRKTRRDLPEVTQTFRYAAPVPFTPYASYDFVAHPAAFGKLRPQTSHKWTFSSKEYPSVMAYLEELKRIYGPSAVTYRYAWWESRAAISTIYPLAGMLIIGGIWPTLLNLLIGAGFGRKKTAGTDYDLSRFKGSSKATLPKPAATLTAEDHRRLAELEALMEQNLQSGDIQSPSSTGTPLPPEAQPALRPLTATQLEHATAAEQARAHKSFGASGGDFYPTEIHKPAAEVNADS